MSRNIQIYTVTTKDNVQHVVEFRWGVSRGRDTYGYNICTCYVDGNRVGRSIGGGYDMKGDSISNWVNNWAVNNKLFDNMEKLPYGFRRYNGKLSVDGACGFDTVLQGIGATSRCLKW